MTSSTVKMIDLSGPWQVAQYTPEAQTTSPPDLQGLDWLPATVPSSVHYDLMKAGKLANPFASSADAAAADWVCAADWVFRRTFTLEQTEFGQDLIALEFDGVDTFSDVWLNGQRVGQTANALRSYRFVVPAGSLRTAENELVIHVKAHRRMIADQVPAAKEHLFTARNPYSYAGKSLVRRYQRSFFGGASLLNLGTEVLGIGLYKPVRLLVLPRTRSEDFHFQVETVSSDLVTASVAVTLAKANPVEGGLTVTATLFDPDGETAARASTTTTGTEAVLSLRILDPKLWWPHGYGPANLYSLRLEVADGLKPCSTTERRVGLKQVKLVRDTPTGRRTFQFVVNGTNIWARGQNLIPIDYIAVHGGDERYDRLLRLVVEGNGNLIRIWGGGALENEHFLDVCDELGIMLWQDFFLHSTTYPDYDAAWVEEFRRESVELVRHLRNHACLSLLCGGNEQEQGWDEWGWQGDLDRFYGEPLIKDLLPELSAAEAPEIPYITNSPHGGQIEASPAEGEMHCWGNYINATKDPLFITETCWNLHSYSRRETLAATMDLDLDQFNDIGWPEKWVALTKLPLITKYPYSDYFTSRTLAGYLRSLEIEHLQADYIALKTLRLMAPSLTGIVNWSFNKGAPLFEFGCVDYLGYPLMNFYAIKRLFADLVVGVYRDINDIHVVASNLTDSSVSAQLHLTHFDCKGSVLQTWNQPATLGPNRVTRIANLDSYYQNVVDRTQEVLHARLEVGGQVVSEDTLFFVPLAEVEVATASPVSVQLTGKGQDSWGSQSWALQLGSSTVHKLVMIEGNQQLLCSDNYFTLVPGSTKRLSVSLLHRTSTATFELSVSSLGVPGEQTVNLS